jgi:hypothetical protein
VKKYDATDKFTLDGRDVEIIHRAPELRVLTTRDQLQDALARIEGGEQVEDVAVDIVADRLSEIEIPAAPEDSAPEPELEG